MLANVAVAIGLAAHETLDVFLGWPRRPGNTAINCQRRKRSFKPSYLADTCPMQLTEAVPLLPVSHP
ncbi:hypothetical protein [Burkholderia cepacia]|uniref:hypothetical protein n=1 Tax=Burkholderia cepacia TaxID=292 RepID=UPI002FDF2A87